MSEMIERVARAIHDTCAPIDRIDPVVAQMAARAAIEAMREPTEDMHHAVVDAAIAEFGEIKGQYLHQYFTWPIMINAALAEKEPIGNAPRR